MTLKQIQRDMKNTLGLYSTVTSWSATFGLGSAIAADGPRPGRPKEATAGLLGWCCTLCGNK